MTYQEYLQGQGRAVPSNTGQGGPMNYQEYKAAMGRTTDPKTVSTQPLQPYGTTPVTTTPGQDLNLAKDFYNNQRQVSGPYAPARSFANAQGTVLPSDNQQVATNKITPDVVPTAPIQGDGSVIKQTETPSLFGRIRAGFDNMTGANKPALFSPTQEVVAKDVLVKKLKGENQESGFMGTLFNTTLPTQLLFARDEPIVNEARQQIRDEYQAEHPVGSVVAQTLGQLYNLFILKKAGAGFNLGAKVETAAGGLRNLAPTLTRVLGHGAESGSIFGIQSLLSESLKQAQARQLDLRKLGSETIKGAGFGVALGGSGALKTLPQRMFASGGTMAGLSLIEGYVSDKKIDSQDIINASVNALVGIGFEAIGGTQRTKMFKENTAQNLAEDSTVTKIMSNNPKLSEPEAREIARVLNKVSYESNKAIYEKAPSSFTGQFKGIDEKYWGASRETKAKYFNKVSEGVVKGEDVPVAIANANRILTPVVAPMLTAKEKRSQRLKQLVAEKQLRVATIKSAETLVNKPSIGLNGYNDGQNQTTPVVTKENLELAKTANAGVALRNKQRESGDNDTPIEKPIYKPSEIKAVEKTIKDTQSHYLYHTTPSENLQSIKENGLVTSSDKRQEVSGANNISLAANEKTAQYYGGQNDVMIRVKKDYKPATLESDLLAGGKGTYITHDNIPASALEIKQGGKWVPITQESTVAQGGPDITASIKARAESVSKPIVEKTNAEKIAELEVGLKDPEQVRWHKEYQKSIDKLNGTKSVPTKKTPTNKVTMVNPATERLAKERAEIAKRGDQGGAVTETIVNLSKETEPVAPNYKTASSYEIGEYYKKKELWDVKHKPVKQRIAIQKEDKASKILEQYNKLQTNEEQLDEDLVKMMELEDQYQELTGVELSVKIMDDTLLTTKGASTNRELYDDIGVPQDVRDIWFRKKGNTNGLNSKPRELSGMEQKIMDIETGRVRFSAVQDALDIVRYFKAHIDRGIKGTEGNLIHNTIGLDNITNLPTLGHELTHLLTRDGTFFLSLFNDPINKIGFREEMTRVYKKYYQGAPKDITTVNPFIMYNEGIAEFVAQHLYNPTKMNKEFPLLSFKFLNHGVNENKQVSEMYDKINTILYTYQNISPELQQAARNTSDINWKKELVSSNLVSPLGRLRTDTVDSLFPMDVVDGGFGGLHLKDMIYDVDKDGVSIQKIAGSINYEISLTAEGLNPTTTGTPNTQYVSWEKGSFGKPKELLPFNVGKLLKEIQDNGDTIRYDVYRQARLGLREIQQYKDAAKKLLDLVKEASLEEDAKTRKKLDIQINKLTEDVKTKKGVVDLHEDSEDNLKHTVSKYRELSKYDERMDLYYSSGILELDVLGQAVSKETANEWRSLPGYTTTAKQIYSDMETDVNPSNRRSAVSNELQKKEGFTGLRKNSIEMIPQQLLRAIQKYNERMFYNYLFEKLDGSGFIEKAGGGSRETNSPGKYVYHKDGKQIGFNVLDKYLTKSIEDTYGKKNLEKNVLDHILEFTHQLAQFMTKITTMYNPYFSFGKNIFLDVPESYMNTKTDYLPIFSQLYRYAKMATNPEFKKQVQEYSKLYHWLGGSARGMYNVSYNNNNATNIIKNIAGQKSWIKEQLSYTKKVFENILGLTEEFNRKEEFIRSMMNGDDAMEAQAKQSQLSGAFSRHGIETQVITRQMSFSNASIQLTDQFGHWFINKDGSFNAKGATKFAIAAIIISSITLLGMYKLIKALDDAITPEETEVALNNIYHYLDKTTYEKVNYSTVGDKYKFATNPLFAAPGLMIGLLMLSNRVPEYKINYNDIAYQVASGPLPNSVSFDVSSPDTFFGSVGGRLAGSNPLGGIIAAMAGYKVFPTLAPIENQNDVNENPSLRYNADTNNLAMLLSRILNMGGKLDWVSPKRIEGMINAVGTGGKYATDAIGAGLLSSQTKDDMGLKHKSLKTLFLTNPLQGALMQNPKILSSETAQKIYDLGKRFNNSKTRADQIISSLDAKYPNGISTNPEDTERYNTASADSEFYKTEISENTKVKDALTVIKAYETNGKLIPAHLISAMNRYILAKSSQQVELVSQDDMNTIYEAAALYPDRKKIDWTTIPNAK